MCFGGKDERNDEPAPRPVQRPVSGQGEDKKSHYMPQYTPGQSAGGPSYAPPEGPPPEHKTTEYAPPSGPPPGQSSQHQYAPPPGPPPGQFSQQGFAPPEGPSPGRSSQHDYAPPPGPPPGQSSQHQEYAPPPGPPPTSNDWIQPPAGLPPSDAKQPQHDWEVAVPDTSLFPPPPAIFSGFERSPTSNADEDDANAGEEWCEQYPLTRPIGLDQLARTALEAGNIRLMQPAGFSGKLNWLSPGRWDGYTAKNSPDRCIIGYPPLYSVVEHDPLRSGRPKTIYYEVQLRADSPTVFLGLGFTALPYPSFRMPGWHRGSLAVHGDDGHKYINDRWGGKSFTDEFRRGDTYGVGMTFRAVGEAKPQVDIFFTRNGTLTGGWALHEETDAEQDLPVTGLEGLHDLSCAIGTYDAVKFEVIFDASRWLYNPYQV
ncbi:hypothetical protein QQZ08_003313 [Neonectria magnoliae]|uniref:SPRY domain-containing protein n=1 Tax=Neonectria magnoliae TaxID=2732573 RepID=A0ABR1IBB5_9HYPO